MQLISIIIAAYEDPRVLSQCLKAVRSSTYNPIELIVVDDGSRNPEVLQVARQYADQVLRHEKNLGRSFARTTGVKAASGDLFIFIDSDIIISADTIAKTVEWLNNNSDTDAVCGILSKQHPNADFFSQYKNLYMHFILSRTSEDANFLYGSFHAIRRKSFPEKYADDVYVADDTAMGQRILSRGGRIKIVKEIELIHLKKYNFFSWVKNDFRIPFDWAQIFLLYHGCRQIGRKGSGYLHASRQQLLSILIAPLSVGGAVGFYQNPFFTWTLILGVLGWLMLNASFFSYLYGEKGVRFMISSIAVTFLDHLIMPAGIICGFFAHVVKAIIKQ